MSKKHTQIENARHFAEPLTPFFLLVLAFLPLVMFPYMRDIYALPKITFLYGATLLLAFAYFVLAVRAERVVVFRSSFDLPILLLLIVAALSLSVSDAPLLGFVGKYKRYDTLPALACYAFFYFLTTQLVRSEKSIERMLKALVIGFVPIALYGIAQAIGYDFPGILRFESRVHSSFGNPILFGAYLVVLLPLLIGLARQAKEESWRNLTWLLVPVALVNLLLTESRGAWLGVAASVVAALALRRFSRPSRPRGGHQKKKESWLQSKQLAIGLTLVALLVLLSAVLMPGGRLVERIASTFSLSEGSAATRIETWKASLAMIGDRPLSGFGVEQMGYWFPAYKTAHHTAIAPTSVADLAHNDFLQYAVNLGIPGLLLFVWLGVLALIRLYQRRKASTYYAAAFIALVGYIAQAQTGILDISIAPVFWVLIGVAAGAAEQRDIVITLPKLARTQAATALVAIVLVFMALFMVKPVAADYYLYKGIQVYKSSPEQAIAEFEKANAIYPYQGEYTKQISEHYLEYAGLTQNSIFAQRAALITEQGLVNYNRRDFELAYYAGEANLLYYRITENYRALEKAEHFFELTEDLWPGLPFIKGKLLDVATLKGDDKKAVAQATEIVAAGEKNPNAYYILATNALKAGARKKAEAYLKKLNEIDPLFLQRMQQK